MLYSADANEGTSQSECLFDIIIKSGYTLKNMYVVWVDNIPWWSIYFDLAYMRVSSILMISQNDELKQVTSSVPVGTRVLTTSHNINW